ncbi:putative 4-coumarate--CoA ligase 3 [Clavelina lepadiformis]|uniref:putative 4-coumarate--CoA ligase 3 n=1 Tax=Clavelina lepadiformis TaxID=159417 RepID=UPI0040424D5E
MTETSGVAVILNKMAWRISSDASGLVAPLNSMKVCDLQTGKELGPNEVGELLVKGPEIMLGYYNNPVATANTLEKDGFLHTGDIGYYDEFNQFYVKDRAKELIKYKGFQVPPAEIEHVLMDHPEIADAAVIGIPDEEAGEVPMAFVVKRIESLSASQVQSFVKDKLSSFKHLRGGVEFVSSIPKSASGKILRRLLRDNENLKTKSKL